MNVIPDVDLEGVHQLLIVNFGFYLNRSHIEGTERAELKYGS
jgi:hypothetical protein